MRESEEEKMFCSNCGKKMDENQKFCGNCGAINPNYKADVELKNLVVLAANGNRVAMEKIYNLTYKQGFSIALQMMKNEQDAMDVMQDSYISAFKNLNRIEKPEKIKSWFNCIVANKCRDYLKRKKPQLFSDMSTEDDREFEEFIVDDNMTFSPEDSVDYSETKRLMKAILDGLPEEQKLCVLMYYYQELSVGEIAEALECSAGTVKSRLNYARKKIKSDVEELEKKGTKLYSVAPIPFILWMLRTGEEDISVPKEFGKTVVKSIVEQNGKGGVNGGKRKIEDTVKAETKKTVKKAAGKALKTKIIAGIASVAVLGGGTFAGYKVYQHLTEENNQKKVTTSEKKKDVKEEKIEEFTLTDEQISEIEQASAWFDYLQKENDGATTRQNYTLTMDKNDLPEDVIKEVADGIVCTDDSIGNQFGDGENVETEECIDFLKNTFGYNAKDINDVKKIFMSAGDDSFYFEKSESKDEDTIYETKRFAQTGKDEYHFYTEVKPYGDFGYNVAGVMDITAHKSEKSKIGGFIFDKVEFTTESETKVISDIENILMHMIRVKAEESGNTNYSPNGLYDVNQYTNQEFVTYANMVISSVGSLLNDIEPVETEEGFYGVKSLPIEVYKDFCENTLGRSEEYDINEIDEIENDKVIFSGFMYDVRFQILNETIYQSLDGRVKITGDVKNVYVLDEPQKSFIATGYASEKSRVGMVIDKIQIEENDTDKTEGNIEAKDINLDDEQIKKIEIAARIFDEFQRNQNIYEREDYSYALTEGAMSAEEWKNVVSGIVCTDDSIGEFITDADDGDRIEKLSVSECRKLLKNTFGYETDSGEEIENVFGVNDNTVTFKHEGIEQIESSMGYLSYEAYKFTQASENTYKFYVYVSSAFRVGQPLVTEGTMEITAHKNENSLISGFVFDDINFMAYVNGKVS